MSNTLNNQHIDEFLKYYCDLESPQYAVMLKGKWGSAKTFYIDKFKNVLKNEKKEYIYVSLYGVTSYDEIETKFFQALHPVLSDKKMLLAGKIAKGILKGAFRVDWDNDGNTDATLSPQLANIDLKNFENTKQHILIFDDLERCSIPISDMLGYINYFVEHQSYKVILLTNEEELNKDDKYNKIKEKLIGKVFEVVSNVDLAYDDFVKYFKDNIKKVFVENKDIIKEIYIQSKYENLRLLRQSILDFARFYELVLKDYNKQVFIKDILKEYFIFSIEFKKGDYDIVNLKEYQDKSYERATKTFDNNYAGEKHKDNENNIRKEKKIKELEKKYKKDISTLSIFEIHLWNDILNKSIINKEKIESVILSTRYYVNDNSPDWKKLYYFRSLTDDEFEQYLTSVETKFKNNTYTDIFVINHVFSILLHLESLKLYKKSQKEIIGMLKDNIDYLYKKKKIKESSFSILTRIESNHMYDGLAYHSIGENANIFYEYIAEKFDEVDEEELKYIAKKFINNFNANDTENINILIKLKNSENIYYKKPIFYFMDLNLFIDKFLSSSYHNQMNFGYTLEDRYTNSEYTKNLIIEIDFLNSLSIKLLLKQKELDGKVSGLNLKEFIEGPLKKAISDLQNYIDNKTD